MSKKIKVGMIGYGFMGKAHSNAYRQASRFFPDLCAKGIYPEYPGLQHSEIPTSSV